MEERTDSNGCGDRLARPKLRGEDRESPPAVHVDELLLQALSSNAERLRAGLYEDFQTNE